MLMTSEPAAQNNHRKKVTGAGIIFGAAVGVGIGTLIGNIGGGTVIGICLGFGIGWMISRKKPVLDDSTVRGGNHE